MGFLSPWFLLGAVALGLPLWLHLLRQFKRTPKPFSSLMFFERRIQSSTRHRRLRYLALLSLRMAMLLLLALAFANPFVNRTSSALKRRTLTVIAVDRSFSMRYGDHFSRAKQEADRLIDAQRPGSMVEVLGFDSRVESLGQPETDRKALHALVNSLQLSDRASSYGEFSRALRVMDETTRMSLIAHLITDVQQTSLPGAMADLQVGPHTELRVHPVAAGYAPNWAIESVTAPARVTSQNGTRVSASIEGFGTTPVSRKVSLILDGHIVESKELTVPDCGRTTVEWTGVDVSYGFHRGQVQIEPHDSLPEDDTYQFSLTRTDARTALFIHRDGSPQDAFYYSSALEASPDGALKIRSDAMNNLTDADLSKYAFVVLNDPGEMDRNLEQKLCDFVAKGGGVLLAVGPNSQRAGRVAVSGENINGTEETQGSGEVDKEADALKGSGTLAGVQFIRPSRLVPKSTDRVLARLAGGSPLLIEARSGEGRILVFASTLDNSNTDFPLHASYLPFVVQTGAYLSGDASMPGSFVVGSPVSLRRTATQTTAADVVGPGGEHELPLTESTRAASYTLERAGFYEIQSADGRRSLLAVHTDRRESDLRQVSAETLVLWNQIGNSKSADPNPGQWEQQTVRSSLWRYALLLALVVATVESMFASRYLRTKEERS